MKVISDYSILCSEVNHYLSFGEQCTKPLLIWFWRAPSLSNILLDKFKQDYINPDQTLWVESSEGRVESGASRAIVFHRYINQMEDSFLRDIIDTFCAQSKPVIVLANSYEFDNRPPWINNAFEQIRFEPVIKIALVSCSKQKIKSRNRVHASDLYISPLFKKAWAYTERLGIDARFILSDKYGLLEEDFLVQPYDESLESKTLTEKKRWSKSVLNDLKAKGFDLDTDCFVFLAGKTYRELLIGGKGKIANPCELYKINGLHGIGEILHFLSI